MAPNHVCRLLARAYRDDGAVLVSKSRDGAIGSGPEQDDLALSLFDSIPGGKTSCFHGSLLGFYERLQFARLTRRHAPILQRTLPVLELALCADDGRSVVMPHEPKTFHFLSLRIRNGSRKAAAASRAAPRICAGVLGKPVRRSPDGGDAASDSNDARVSAVRVKLHRRHPAP